MSTVRLESVSKQFGNVVAVKGVTATIPDGEFVSLLGPSGCGKTTVLRMVAGFEKRTGGSIYIGEREVSGPNTHVPPNDRNLGMVFQTYAVWPHMTVFENIAYPLRVRRQPDQQVKRKVQEVLELVHLEGYGERIPSQLSGGQQQRVALARALAAEPAVLLLDEPLSNLDAKLREELRMELKLLSRRLGITVLNVTHDQVEAMGMSDRILVMEKGEVVQAGAPREIYERPASRYVANFVGMASLLPATLTEPGRCTLASGHSLPCPEVKGLALGAQVDLLIRPEGVDIAGGELPATVLNTLYIGGETEVLLEVCDIQVRTKVPGWPNLSPGSEIRVGLTPNAVFGRE